MFFSALKPNNNKDLTFILVLYEKAILKKPCHDFDHAKKNQG